MDSLFWLNNAVFMFEIDSELGVYVLIDLLLTVEFDMLFMNGREFLWDELVVFGDEQLFNENEEPATDDDNKLIGVISSITWL